MDPEFNTPPRILVVGESFLDVWYVGEATRLSPEAPLPVVSIDEILKLPGGANNVVQNLEALGASVQPFTVHAGVKNRLVVHGGQQLARWDERDGCEGFKQNTALRPVAQSYDAVVVSDYGKGFLTEDALAWLEQFRSLPFFVDTKASPTRFARFPIVTFFPNQREFNQHKAAYCALETPFVLKRAADGMEYWRGGADGPMHFARASAKAVNSVCGAGDVVLAAYTLNMLRYENPRSALAFAAAAAACACEMPFTSVPTLSRVYEKLQEAA